jgi:diguanylate cyclase (GGDEF)-like protein
MSSEGSTIPFPVPAQEPGPIPDPASVHSPQGMPEADILKLARQLYEDLRRAQEGLAFQARHDFLTGLWNRAAILNILHQEVARSDRQHMPFGVIVFSIDGLKKINETEGEMVGDSVLRAVARRLLPAMRPYDSVGRTSGNQFLIVAPGCDAVGASSMAERIRRIFEAEATDVTAEVSEEITDEPEERRIPVTLSLGVYTTDDADDPERLLKGAKETLYLAKEAGGNRVVMAALPSSAKAAFEKVLDPKA